MKAKNLLSTLLGSIGQIVVGSIMWVFCCLPIFTIGPASTALYYAVVKVIRRERSNMIEAFFHAFKVNFWQSLNWNLILLSYYAVIALSATLRIRAVGGFVLDTTMGIIIAFGALLIWLVPFVYAVISRFFHRGTALFRFVLYIAVRYFWVTLIAIALLIGCFALTLYNSALLMFVPGIYALVLSYLLEPVFKSMSSQEEDPMNYDEWYADEEDPLAKAIEKWMIK